VDRQGICAIGVMAKAPQPGLAKTRLCPPLNPAQAAELSAAFLRDITENIALAAQAVPIHGCIAYAPAGAEGWFTGHIADGTSLVLADGAPPMPPGVRGFGRCLLHAAQAILAAGFGAACLVNSDSPTLPTALLRQAADALLARGERIVLGPADDGGYYLLGMQRPYARLFADIAWSTGDVAAATCERATALGLEVLTQPTWYDVDDAESLARLLAELAGAAASDAALRPYAAPATRRCVERIALSERLGIAAQ
jgi:rSAM/selenodomain-associated transferase 1